MRKIYFKHRITKQKLVHHIAPAKFKSDEKQTEELEKVKKEYVDAKAEGYEII